MTLASGDWPQHVPFGRPGEDPSSAGAGTAIGGSGGS